MASYGYGGGWAPYVPVAERRRKAEKMVASLKKKGRICVPVVINGRAIAATFWGKKWCEHLETFSDHENRLPRGRTYARNGSIVDLQIAEEKISALVVGSSIYEVNIKVHPLDKALWQALLDECAGKVASLVELLQGRLSGAVMDVVTRQGSGLFPLSHQIRFKCSCPDSASMCKHVAAVLYGVGARFDSQPELLFRLRHVDPQELIRQAGNLPAMQVPDTYQGLGGADLSALFGIDLGDAGMAMPQPAASAPPLPAPSAPVSKPRATAVKPAAPSGSKRSKTITSMELGERGIPVSMRQSWLNSGVLLRTEQRGVYAVTKQTEQRIADYLARFKTAQAK
ncbi:MAG: hypothetical protein V4724_10470 [Pseudomonadota bacterium]